MWHPVGCNPMHQQQSMSLSAIMNYKDSRIIKKKKSVHWLQNESKINLNHDFGFPQWQTVTIMAGTSAQPTPTVRHQKSRKSARDVAQEKQQTNR